MKKAFKLLLLVAIPFVLNSCEDDEPCQGDVTTFVDADGRTRTIEQPCFDNSDPFQPF